MTNQPVSLTPSHDADKKVSQTKDTSITDGATLDPELAKGRLKKTSKQNSIVNLGEKKC